MLRSERPNSPRPGGPAAIPIYFDELADVLRACTQLRPDECSPSQLRALMADHLSKTAPGLADKVLAFVGPQLVALSAFVL